MGEHEYKITVQYGRSECRSWIEVVMMPDGSLKLIGMGSRTDYDDAGNVTAYKCEPTGIVGTM